MATLDERRISLTPTPPISQSLAWTIINSVSSWFLDKALVLLILAFMLLPILWLGLTAFKPLNTVYSTEILVVPTLNNFRIIFGPVGPVQLEDEFYGAADGFGRYPRVAGIGNDMGRQVVNSVVISSATVLIAVPLAAMAAYVFSRFRFMGDTALLIWVLVTQFIPAIIVVIPFFTLYRQIGLLGTHIGVIIVNLSMVMPYAIWMIKGFVDALPTEIEEAALVDGCNEAQVLLRITAPLIAPGVVVAAVFAFIMSWNEFLFALTLGRDAARTLQVGLTTTEGVRGVAWEQMSAAGVVVLVPIFVLSMFIRKNFVKGLTSGAVK